MRIETTTVRQRSALTVSSGQAATLLLFALTGVCNYVNGQPDCRPIYVRWPRVRLNFPPAQNGIFPLTVCQTACARDIDPNDQRHQQCSAFNHRAGATELANECQIFQREAIQHTDGYVEADDRYTFYWKYCVRTSRTCAGAEYAFTFLSDRYMAIAEVMRRLAADSLEDCLAACLDEPACRSVSFNRTDGGCHVSTQNQLTKPGQIRINNNPNYRIDYYENNCANVSNSFHFHHHCEEKGIRLDVDSRLPYTGALYGLYDFFSCRMEPRESQQFGLFFPYPTVSNNCSDSMRYTGNDVVLEVVLSTDGVEPLYFITADDLTYQARCPVTETDPTTELRKSPAAYKNDAQKSSKKAAEKSAAQLAGVRIYTPPSQDSTKTTTTTTTTTKKLTSKDTFTLPLIFTESPTTSKVVGTDIRVLSEDQKTPNIITVRRIGSEGSQRLTSSSTVQKSFQATPTGSTGYPTGPVEPVEAVELAGLQSRPVEPPGSPRALVGSSSSSSGFIDALRANSRTSVDAYNAATAVAATAHSHHHDHPNYGDRRRHPGLEAILDPAELVFRDAQHFGAGAIHEVQLPAGGRTSTPQAQNFSFSTYVSFPADNRITVANGPPASPATEQTVPSTTMTIVSTTTTTTASTTTTTTPVTTTTTVIPPPTTLTVRQSAIVDSATPRPPGVSPTVAGGAPAGETKRPAEPVIFDIFHNGQTTEAVVVGSRITLTFTPYFAIPPQYMSISGCQVEPIGSLYDWERDPLPIIKEGCQADHVGLVCPPQRTDFGIRVTVEAFRYQTTTQVQYSCLVRVCPFAVCPPTTCNAVEGCPGGAGDDLLTRSFGGARARRSALTFEQIRAALAENPRLQEQLALETGGGQPPASSAAGPPRTNMNTSLQQQLVALGGDHLVRKRLIVVNSEEDLQYYVRTGEVPRSGAGLRRA